MSGWYSQIASSNNLRQTYINGFLDISGTVSGTNGLVLRNGDASFNGGLSLNGNFKSNALVTKTTVTPTPTSYINSAGTLWTEQDGIGNNSWYDCAVSGTGAVQVAIVYYGSIWTSADSGANWTERTGPGAQNWISCSISTDGTRMVAAASGGSIWISMNSGVTWTEQASTTLKNWTNCAISGNGAAIVAVVGNGNIWTAAYTTVWTFIERTTIGAIKNWFACSISFTGTRICAVIYGDLIYASNDSGATFTSQTTAAGTTKWNSCSMSSDGSRIFATNYGGTTYWAYWSSGNTWTWVADTNTVTPNKNWLKCSMSSDGSVTLALVYASTGNTVWKSTYGGNWGSWTQVTMPAASTSVYWQSISLSSTGLYVTAVISGGSIFTSANTGGAWTERNGTAAKNWNGVAMSPDGTQIVGIVGNGSIWISLDSGNTWTAQTGPGTANWQSVSMSADGTKMIAAINAGGIWTAAYSAGAWTWTDRTTPSGSRVWSGCAISNDGTKMIGVVSASGSIYASFDSGTTWTQQTANFLPTAAIWKSCAMSGDGTKVAACINSGTNGTVWTGTYSTGVQISWTPRSNAGTTRGWNHVAMTPDGNNLLASVGSGYLYTFTDSGATFVERQASGSTQAWNGVSISSDGTYMLAAINPGALWLSADSGVTWTKLTGAGVRYWFGKTAMNSTGTRLAASESNSVNSSIGSIWTSTQTTTTMTSAMGTVPTQMYGLAANWHRMCCSDSGQYIAAVQFQNAAASAGGYIYVSNDYGATWTAPATVNTATRSWNGISMSSNGQYMLASASNNIQLYRSADYGVTWTATGPAANATAYWWGTTVSSTGQYMIAGWFTNSSSFAIYLSNDYGLIFTSVLTNTTSVNQYTVGSMSYDGTYMLCGTNTGGLYRSINKGSSWTVVTTGYMISSCIYATSMSNTGQYAAFCNIGGYVYVSNNYGGDNNWTQITTLGAANWQCVSVSSTGQYMMANNTDSTGQVYYSSNYGVTWAQLTSSARKYYGGAMSRNGQYIFGHEFTGYLYKISMQNQSTVSNTFNQLSIANSVDVAGGLSLSGTETFTSGTSLTPYVNAAGATISPNSTAATSATWVASGVSWTASASSFYSGYFFYGSFDTVISATNANNWASSAIVYNTTAPFAYNTSTYSTPILLNGTTTSVLGEWLQLSSGAAALCLNTFAFAPHAISNGIGCNPGTFYIVGANSSNPTTWTPLVYGTFVSLPYASSTSYVSTPTYSVPGTSGTTVNGALQMTSYGNVTSTFTYFRLVITNIIGTLGGATTDGYGRMGEWTLGFKNQVMGPSQALLSMDSTNYNQLNLNGGLSVSNGLTLSYTTLPAFGVNQIGYTITGSNSISPTHTGADWKVYSSMFLPIGVWILDAACLPPSNQTSITLYCATSSGTAPNPRYVANYYQPSGAIWSSIKGLVTVTTPITWYMAAYSVTNIGPGVGGNITFEAVRIA